MEMICMRCGRSRYVYQLTQLDKKTKKSWKVSRCSKCEFNITLEEVEDNRGLGKVRKDWL